MPQLSGDSPQSLIYLFSSHLHFPHLWWNFLSLGVCWGSRRTILSIMRLQILPNIQKSPTHICYIYFYSVSYTTCIYAFFSFSPFSENVLRFLICLYIKNESRKSGGSAVIAWCCSHSAILKRKKKLT